MKRLGQEARARHLRASASSCGFDARDHVGRAGEQSLDHRSRRFAAHQRACFNSAREEEIVGAADDDADARARAVDFRCAAQRRARRHQIRALDQDVRLGKADLRRAHRLDREKADVPRVRRQALEHFARLVVEDELERNAEPSRQLAGEVGGDAAGAVTLPPREHRVAEVDGGAQRARRGELGNGSSGIGHGGAGRKKEAHSKRCGALL